jgi:hypothetical protein
VQVWVWRCSGLEGARGSSMVHARPRPVYRAPAASSSPPYRAPHTDANVGGALSVLPLRRHAVQALPVHHRRQHAIRLN